MFECYCDSYFEKIHLPKEIVSILYSGNELVIQKTFMNNKLFLCGWTELFQDMQTLSCSETALIEDSTNEKPIESTLENLSALELIANIQKLKADEKKLTEQKQELFSKEKNLRRSIAQEILNKEKKMQELRAEIQILQDRCYKFTQALQDDPQNTCP